jgi:hypothetical protein
MNTPPELSDVPGGFHCLTLAHAFMARAGLLVTPLIGIGVDGGYVIFARGRAHQWRSIRVDQLPVADGMATARFAAQHHQQDF